MAFYPDTYKWDLIVNPLDEDAEPIYCGCEYNLEKYGTHYIKFGQVFTVDCSGFDETVNVDEAHAFTNKIVEFSNGSYYRLAVWASTGWNGNATVSIKIQAFDKNNNLLPNAGGGLTILLDGAGGKGHFGCPPAYIKTVGVKFTFLTSYYGWGSDLIYGLTPPYYFGLYYFAPLLIYPDQEFSGLNNILSVVEDGATVITGNSDSPLPSIDDPIGPFWNWVFITQNMDTYMTNLGGGISYGSTAYEEPNQDIDPSGTGGGNGNYQPADGTGGGGYTKDSQPVDFPALPTGGALATGAIKAFIVNQSIITSLFQELWNSSIIDIASWQKLFSDPMSALVSLHCLPYTPTGTGSAAIHLGNIDFNDAITAAPVTNQYKTIDCGKYTLKPFWGSALDLSPYTKVELFVPFVGIREIKPEDCLGLELHLKYNADVITGDVTAQLKCGQSVLYKWTGNCKATVPVSAEVNSAMEKWIKAIGGGVAAAASGNPAALIASGVNTALTKTSIQRSGDISGAVGMLDEFLPYLIIHRPVQSLAKDFRKYKGYPSNITAVLSTLKGYTEVEHINLSVAGATDEELREIEELLKQGVLL